MSKKEKTYYLFYLIGTPTAAYEQPRLSAFTDDKSLAETFEKYRNMDLYIKKKAHFTKAEALKFSDKYKSCRITIGVFETKSPEALGKRYLDVPVPCTYGEEEQIFLMIDKVFHDIGKDTLFYNTIPKECFTEEVQELLEMIRLREINQFYMGQFGHGETVDEYLNSGFDDFGIIEDHKMRVDQLGLFIYWFGNLMNKDVVKE